MPITDNVQKKLTSDLEFSWSFKEIDLPFRQLKYVECTLICDAKVARGYGEGFRVDVAVAKSYSEAWERFWMHYGHEYFKEKFGPGAKNSNGFSAHPDLSTAKLNSRLELIERAEVLSTWQAGGRWKKTTGFVPYLLNELCKSLLKSDWTLELYSISSFKSYETLIGILVSLTKGVAFDSTCVTRSKSGAHKLPGYLKLFLSLIRTIPFEYQPIQSLNALDWFGSPSDHIRFYRNPNHIVAFDPHRHSVGTGFGLLGNLERIETNILLAESGFPILAQSTHPDWPALCWGRSSLASSTSNWPHPIG